MILVVPLFIFVLLPACIGALVTTDLLVRLEFNFHPEDWKADGEPFGVVWTPPGRKRGLAYALGNFGITGLSWRWLLSTPDWIRTDARALRLVRWMRICSVVWMGGIILVLFILVISAPRS